MGPNATVTRRRDRVSGRLRGPVSQGDREWRHPDRGAPVERGDKLNAGRGVGAEMGARGPEEVVRTAKYPRKGPANTPTPSSVDRGPARSRFGWTWATGRETDGRRRGPPSGGALPSARAEGRRLAVRGGAEVRSRAARERRSYKPRLYADSGTKWSDVVDSSLTWLERTLN